MTRTTTTDDGQTDTGRTSNLEPTCTIAPFGGIKNSYHKQNTDVFTELKCGDATKYRRQIVFMPETPKTQKLLVTTATLFL